MNNLLRSVQIGSWENVISSSLNRQILLLIAVTSISIAPASSGVAQTCQDGCFYSNTYQGGDALLLYTLGGDNTAFGYLALNQIEGTSNTAVGALTISSADSEDAGEENTAMGAATLEYVGGTGFNEAGNQNTAVGDNALNENVAAALNTAVGASALYYNSGIFGSGGGDENTAIGAFALDNNFAAFYNTATGVSALYYIDGASNTAHGYHALYGQASSSASNTAVGNYALSNVGDSSSAPLSNIGLGDSGGLNLTSGSSNIDIGNKGIAGESKTIRIGKKGTQTTTVIAGIQGTTIASGVGVIIDSTGRLGTTTSSARYKECIRSMGKASDAILSLQPVTFRYKQQLDPANIQQFGLVAEEVEKVDPSLVAHDEEGKPYSVRYEAVNAMLLDQFLKAHGESERRAAGIDALAGASAKQERTLAAQEKEIRALTARLRKSGAQLEKVNAQLEAN